MNQVSETSVFPFASARGHKDVGVLFERQTTFCDRYDRPKTGQVLVRNCQDQETFSTYAFNRYKKPGKRVG